MTANAIMPFPAHLKTSIKIDPVMLLIVATLLLGGFVILASASITVSDNVAGRPFFYVERQLLAALLGGAAAFACLMLPMRVWQALSPVMLLVSLALLCLVLVPGIGVEVNGATRWMRIGFMNLQASEPARLCLLIFLAGYAVRQQKNLRERFAVSLISTTVAPLLIIRTVSATETSKLARARNRSSNATTAISASAVAVTR
jgi:cell division protein FtsW